MIRRTTETKNIFRKANTYAVNLIIFDTSFEIFDQLLEKYES